VRLGESIEAVVREAQFCGVERDALIERVARTAREIYGAQSLRIGFIECSLRDAQTIAEDLSRHVGLSITPILLDDVLADRRRAWRGFDLVCTTFFHLQEVSADLDPHAPEIVAIHHMPSHESILEVARLPRGITVGIVCPNARTLERVQTMVRTYIQADVLACTVDDRQELERVARDASVIVDTVTSHDVVLKHAPEVPTITVLFHIERQSIEYLQVKLRELLSQSAAVA
jgi:hypothetical protein